MTRTNPKFNLTKIISDSEFTGTVVWGPQREGKTSYCYQVMHDLYDGDWNEVFAHTFFDIDDFIDYLRKLYRSRKKDLCILWDDAGVHGSSQLYWTNRDLVQLLEALLDVIGTLTQGLIISAVSRSKLVKAIRNYEWLNVHIIKADPRNGRIAKGYKTRVLPSGDIMNPARVFEDHFNKLMPDNVFTKYNEIRYAYGGDVLDALFEKREELKLLKAAQLAKASDYLAKKEQGIEQ